MGLDMFLEGINYNPAEYDENYNVIKKRTIISTLEVDWRKANHIHKWFVENVQWGEDDCHHYDVSHEKLKKLRNDCQKVLDNKEKADKILPTQSGFFFGSTDYDEFYFSDIEYTIKEIDRLLSNEDEYDWFEYHSSW